MTEAVQLGTIRGAVSATAVVESLAGADFSAIASVQSERCHNPGDLVASVPVADAVRFTDGASARGVAATRPAPEPLRVVSRAQPEAGATAVPVRLAFLEVTAVAGGTKLGGQIEGEQRSNVPFVPTIAVVKDGNMTSMFVTGDAQARKRQMVLACRMPSVWKSVLASRLAN